MTVNERVPGLNTPVTVSLIVQNDGPGQAKGIVVRNRLPTNLTFVSSADLSATGPVLNSAALDLNPGEVKTLSFIAQPTAPGTYQNAAEIAQATTTDSDSQSNSGTGDGQDDAAQADFRTRQTGAAVYSSPNPNQVPLPSVISNQPIPDPNKADVSIQLSVNTRTPRLNEVVSYSLTISNAGGLKATGLSATVYLPAGLAFLPGDDFWAIGW